MVLDPIVHLGHRVVRRVLDIAVKDFLSFIREQETPDSIRDMGWKLPKSSGLQTFSRKTIATVSGMKRAIRQIAAGLLKLPA
jgi:hypothetical protein